MTDYSSQRCAGDRLPRWICIGPETGRMGTSRGNDYKTHIYFTQRNDWDCWEIPLFLQLQIKGRCWCHLWTRGGFCCQKKENHTFLHSMLNKSDMMCSIPDVAQWLGERSHVFVRQKQRYYAGTCTLVIQYIMRPDGLMLIVSYEPMKLVSLGQITVICHINPPLLCPDEGKYSNGLSCHTLIGWVAAQCQSGP